LVWAGKRLGLMAELADISKITVEFEALARRQLAAGDMGEAEQTARALIAVAPNAAACWYLLGEILSAVPGRRAEAAEAFSSALKFDPENTSALDGQKALSARSTAAPASGQSKQMLPHLAAMAGKDALIADARAAEASERWQDARVCWERVLENDPGDTWAWSQYGHMLCVHLHRYSDAETAYRRAIEEDPTDDWAWGKLGIMLADFQGRVSEGQSLLREAIRLDAREPYYRGWLGWSLYRQSENLEAAEAELLEATRLQRDYQWAHFHLGYVRYVMGTKPQKARTDFLKAIELDPQDIAALYNLGALLAEQLGQPRQAAKAFLGVLGIDPDHAASHFRLAQIYEQNKATYNQARHHYQQILVCRAEDPVALRSLAYLYCEKLDQFEEAATVFKQALKHAPDDDEMLHRYGCMLWHDLNQPDEAIAHLRAACNLAPEVELYWASIGEAHACAKQDFEAAEDCFKRALDIAPDYYWVHTHLGEILFSELGRSEEARKHLCRSVEINPDYAWGWHQYAGFLSRHMQDFDSAQHAYEMAVKLEPEDQNALVDLVYMNLAARSRADLAVISAATLCKQSPENGEAWALYATAQRYLEEDTQVVAACFEKATSLDTDNHWCWHSRAEHTLYDCGDILESEQMLVRAAGLETTCTSVSADLGLIRLAQGEHDIARALVEKALEDDDESANNWRLYGRFLYLINEDHALVEEALDRAVEYGPYNFENPLFLAVFLKGQPDRQPEAAAAWMMAKALAPIGCDIERWADLQMRPRFLAKFQAG